MKQFETIDISGDAGIRAFGRDLSEVFENAATGMYSLIANLSLVEKKREIGISAEGPSLEGLFISWLNELIFQFDAYGFIAKRVVISELQLQTDDSGSRAPFTLKATLSGEDFDPERHEGNLLIKAATYHKLRIERTGDMWEADVIFDI
ncbi:MAG: archease [Nitrospirota bacterium]